MAGWLLAPRAVLRLVAALSATSILAVLAIKSRWIDHDLALGSDKDRDGQPSGLRVIFECSYKGGAPASWGLGAPLSNSIAGFIVGTAGFSAAFLFLACCAFAAFRAAMDRDV